MSRYWSKAVDKNHGEIRDDFRADGWKCRDTHRLNAFCDFITRPPWEVRTVYLIEVKVLVGKRNPKPSTSAKGYTKKNQEEFAADFPVTVWQEWASPVWMTIDQTNVLNVKMARDEKDERHLCPLQLDLIERLVTLWTNAGDTVYSPFMGIGSEGYVAVRQGRRFVGTELKTSYFRQACRYIAEAEANPASGGLFGVKGAVA